MRTSINKKQNIIVYAAIILLLLVVVSSCMVSGLLAKYTAGKTGSDQARVAMFEFNETLSNEQVQQILVKDLKPGDTAQYIFTVSNFSTTTQSVSETALRYEFEVICENNLPLTYSVSGVNSTNTGSLASRVINRLKWNDGTMPAGEQTLHTYTVDIAWDVNEKEYEYSEEIDMLVITLKSEQID